MRKLAGATARTRAGVPRAAELLARRPPARSAPRTPPVRARRRRRPRRTPGRSPHASGSPRGRLGGGRDVARGRGCLAVVAWAWARVWSLCRCAGVGCAVETLGPDGEPMRVRASAAARRPWVSQSSTVTREITRAAAHVAAATSAAVGTWGAARGGGGAVRSGLTRRTWETHARPRRLQSALLLAPRRDAKDDTWRDVRPAPARR